MVDIIIPHNQDPLYKKIHRVIVSHKIVKPDYYDAVTEDMYQWAMIHKRDMTMDELNSILKKYK